MGGAWLLCVSCGLCASVCAFYLFYLCLYFIFIYFSFFGLPVKVTFGVEFIGKPCGCLPGWLVSTMAAGEVDFDFLTRRHAVKLVSVVGHQI